MPPCSMVGICLLPVYASLYTPGYTLPPCTLLAYTTSVLRSAHRSTVRAEKPWAQERPPSLGERLSCARAQESVTVPMFCARGTSARARADVQMIG